MPRAKANAAPMPVEPVKPVEPEEQVNLEDAEEEVEYEEIEEEIEEEEEVEVEEEEEDEDATVENGTEEGAAKDSGKKHAELLALPPHGSEIYVGNVHTDASDEDLKTFFGSIGEVTEVRIMRGKDGKESKGYGFIAYKTKELASKAIVELNNAEFKGRKLKVSTSQAKNKLFIGNVPRTWSEDDIKKVVTEVGPGVTLVEVVKDSQNSSRNRGYCFVEYYNHACAEHAKKKMSATKFKLDSKKPTVSWADGKSTDTTLEVKAIYVKNLPEDVVQDDLKELFKHHGEITKVVLPPAKSGHEKARYGFVHFADKSMALSAIKETERYELDGQVIECSLAKPPSEKKSEPVSSSQKPILSSYPPRYSMMGAGYGIPGNYAVAASYGQPMMYGRGGAPGVAMVPMMLPDGRLGYVLQQPGVQSTPPSQQRSGGNRSGGSGGSKHGSSEGNRNRRYRPY